MLNDILQKLYAIEHIPSLPSMKANIISNINIIKSDKIEELAGIISYDPTLSIEFLKIANADSFGYKNKISSIHNALVLFDENLIELLISQHPVMPALKVYQDDLKNEFQKLLKHTIEVHLLVQIILNVVLKDEATDDNLRQDILTASTLHDIGLFFLLIYFPGDYLKIINRIMENETAQKSGNKRGVSAIPDHSLVGSVLCQFWNLPSFISTLISFHHYPWAGDERYRIGAEVIYIADTISSSFYDLFRFNDMYSIDEHIVMRRRLIEIIEKLGLDIAMIAEMRIQSLEQTNKLYSDFGL